VDPDLVLHSLVLPMIMTCLHRHTVGACEPNGSPMTAPDLFRRHFTLALEGLIQRPSDRQRTRTCVAW
jgi:hypothetical protein